MPSPRSNRVHQARAWAIGLNVVYGLIGMGLIGFAIDHFAGTRPLWTLILGGLGLVAGLYRFVREALAMSRKFSVHVDGAEQEPERSEPEPDPWDERWEKKWGDPHGSGPGHD